MSINNSNFQGKRFKEMPIIKISRAAPLALPAELRKPLKFAEGDYLEAIAHPDGILLKPVAVASRSVSKPSNTFCKFAKSAPKISSIFGNKVEYRLPRSLWVVGCCICAQAVKITTCG